MKFQFIAMSTASMLFACRGARPVKNSTRPPPRADFSDQKQRQRWFPLPAPEMPVDVAVYDFPILRGQAKPKQNFAEYGRARDARAAPIS